MYMFYTHTCNYKRNTGLNDWGLNGPPVPVCPVERQKAWHLATGQSLRTEALEAGTSDAASI